MTIIQLQYVLAVAQYKNFSTAAKKCFVTQPTLSMQILKLEEELDILIFDRTKKPIEATDIGAKIIEQAKNIVNESQRIKDIISIHKGFIGGEFRLGIIPTIAPTLLPMFLNNFIKKYPKIDLKIEELNTQDTINYILQGELDAAIVATPLKEDFIVEKPLFHEPFVAYIPNNHRLRNNNRTIKISDLKVEDILMLEDGHCFRNSVLNLCQPRKKALPNETFEIRSGSFETLIKLANEGLGMTLLPYLHTLDLSDENKKNLSYFSEPSPAREISLIYHNNELKSNIINALHKLISEIVRGAIAFENVKIISPLQKK